ncbi:hypothetical protein FRC06_009012 [Ceratobasidium sp. 370]|nr:hypothetical protein FRC06_009012 [Ceratobasidium sp. 370]
MGNFMSMVSPPKSLFTVEQIPDLTGQVVIVRGDADNQVLFSGNTGIGKETCKGPLLKNAKVYLAALSKAKANDAIEWLKNETNGKTAIFLQLDLADFSSIRKAVGEFKSKEQELHVLFNNAGVMVPPVEQRTADGYDLQFGTNVLGHYLLTTLLLPTLIRTAKHSTAAGGHARIVHTSSAAMKRPPRGGIVWGTLGTDQASLNACKRVGKFMLYCQSKLKLFYNVLIFPASQGALTQLYAGTTPEPEHLNGKFLVPWAQIGDTGPIAKDEKLGEKLWSWCEEQVKHVSET